MEGALDLVENPGFQSLGDQAAVRIHVAIPEREVVVGEKVERVARPHAVGLGDWDLATDQVELNQRLQVPGDVLGRLLADRSRDVAGASLSVGDRLENRSIEDVGAEILEEQLLRFLVQEGVPAQSRAPQVVLEAAGGIELLEIGRHTAKNRVDLDTLARRVGGEEQRCFRVIEGLELEFPGPPVVEGRVRTKHLALHEGHVRTTEKELEIGQVLVLIPPVLDRRQESAIDVGEVGHLVENGDDRLVRARAGPVDEEVEKDWDRGEGLSDELIGVRLTDGRTLMLLAG